MTRSPQPEVTAYLSSDFLSSLALATSPQRTSRTMFLTSGASQVNFEKLGGRNRARSGNPEHSLVPGVGWGGVGQGRVNRVLGSYGVFRELQLL